MMTAGERPIGNWARIRLHGEGDGQLEVPSTSAGVETGYGLARFAIGAQGEPRLLVPCGSAATLPKELASTRNLQIGIGNFQLNGRTVRYLDITCLNRSLDAVFAELAEEILYRLQSGAAPGEAAVTTIRDFVELLDPADTGEVDPSMILGLLGEWIVLERLVALAADAAEAWVGPFEQRHDIRRGTHAIEVKTSGRQDATLVRINGIDQLLEPAGGSLTLFHVRLERAQDGSLCVSTLYDRLVAAGASSQALRKGLAQLGCTDPSAPPWNGARYELEGLRAYAVSDGFPRVVSTSFAGGDAPQGVREVTYCVDLGAAQRFEIAADSIESVLQRLVG